MPNLFLPQAKLEEWALSETADLSEGTLVVAGEASPYPLEPAVHFTQLATGNDDRKLLNKVKTQAQLEAMKAEQMAESVLVGDTAYEVVTGYLLQAGPGSAPGASGNTDTNLLADFLLKKL